MRAGWFSDRSVSSCRKADTHVQPPAASRGTLAQLFIFQIKSQGGLPDVRRTGFNRERVARGRMIFKGVANYSDSGVSRSFILHLQNNLK